MMSLWPSSCPLQVESRICTTMVVMTWKVGTVAVEAERPHVTLPQA